MINDPIKTEEGVVQTIPAKIHVKTIRIPKGMKLYSLDFSDKIIREESLKNNVSDLSGSRTIKVEEHKHRIYCLAINIKNATRKLLKNADIIYAAYSRFNGNGTGLQK